MKNSIMDLKIASNVKPPVHGHATGQGSPKTARWYLERMKPGQSVLCKPEEANRFRPAASRLHIPIVSEKEGKGVRVWKLKPPVKTIGKSKSPETIG